MIELPIFNDDDVTRLLCIVAHPDDMEYGASAAVAKWTDQGKPVSYLLLTRGEAGIRDMNPEKVAPLRADEQRQACTIVGVEDLEILEFPDGLLEPNLELRHAIAKKIRQFKPDAVMVTNWELNMPWGLNHVDHRAAGIATVDAIRDADNPWVFTDLKEAGLDAWKADRLLVNGADATHAVVLDDEHVDQAVRSLEAHTVYLEALPDHPVPSEMIPGITSEAGTRAGVKYALPVQVFDM
ncbi:MAG: PIG-L deacetylase family protein [Brevibacterium aurantiacum]|uniref:N-acetylglucosaminyl deacetylase, LmbE family n=1 Tax=Brevibacterium aurantiacum TaxID=273384 RepID=A0A2H1I983_BREAU|nr:PIG-L deacetylase family protein [Brevibacterium aurantiacum]RCS89488.1 PIG-L family deacetylase [Brevibacterium aurantiacum]SMX71771.1 N-acetylglucosaminyl deacetylase, LmbE family [Brevibacterium aurantiacum]